VRLATFNLLHGRSLSDGQVDVPRLREAVAALDADVLGMQEVDRAQPRSARRDLTAEAAAAMGGAGRFAPAMMGTPGERWRPARDGDAARVDEPSYGVALITRLPVLRWSVTRLPSAPVRSPILIPGPTRRVVWLRDEPRVLLAAVLDTPAGPLTVGTTHLSFVPGWNGAQLRWAARAMRRLPAPRVLLGDLNLPGALPRWLTGWRALATLPTYPADQPKVQLDHVLEHGTGLPAVLAAQAPPMPLSDHRALLVDLAAVPPNAPDPPAGDEAMQGSGP
jgi:endonuclease/exonuclease/phosphatase family metal-dependent hydrolase